MHYFDNLFFLLIIFKNDNIYKWNTSSEDVFTNNNKWNLSSDLTETVITIKISGEIYFDKIDKNIKYFEF